MQQLTSSGHAPVNGLNMYYEIYGTGEMPLVLIHGGGSTIGTSFGNLLPMLQGRIIAAELQAHGRTSDRDAPETFEQDADDVAALLKYLNIPKANILGFSNGGTTTLQLVLRHPALINKMIVVSANYKRDGMMAGFFDGMQHATIDHMPQSLKDAFLKVTPDQSKLQAMFEKDKQRMLDFKDIADDDLKTISVPALIMVGDRDVMTVAHVLQMAQLIPGAQLAVLPGGHGALIGEEGTIKEGSKLLEITVMLVEEFLNG